MSKRWWWEWQLMILMVAHFSLCWQWNPYFTTIVKFKSHTHTRGLKLKEMSWGCFCWYSECCSLLRLIRESLWVRECLRVCACVTMCTDGWHKKWHNDLLPCVGTMADTSDKKTGSHTKFIFTLLSLHCCSFWQAHGQAHRGQLTLPTTPVQMHSKITQNQSQSNGCHWNHFKFNASCSANGFTPKEWASVSSPLLSQWKIISEKMLFCLLLFCLGQKESSPGAFSSLVIR